MLGKLYEGPEIVLEYFSIPLRIGSHINPLDASAAVDST